MGWVSALWWCLVQSCKLWSAYLVLYTNWMSGLSDHFNYDCRESRQHQDAGQKQRRHRVKRAAFCSRFRWVWILTWIKTGSENICSPKFLSSSCRHAFRLAQALSRSVAAAAQRKHHGIKNRQLTASSGQQRNSLLLKTVITTWWRLPLQLLHFFFFVQR